MRLFILVTVICCLVLIGGCGTTNNRSELISVQQTLINNQRELLLAQRDYIILLEELCARQEMLIESQDSLNLVLIIRLAELDPPFRKKMEKKFPGLGIFEEKKPPPKKLLPSTYS